MLFNPSAVKDQIQFLSAANIDKVVRVYEGVFQPADAVINARLSAGGIDVYVYRIAHGLTRPVFPELLWSVDNTIFIDGGSAADSLGNASLAFSDSTYVYMFSPSLISAYAGPVYYKFICSWIDDYDDTNPSIQSIMYRTKPIAFDSRVNLQKIYDHGVTSITGAGLSKVIAHPLGYIPNAKVFFEAFPGEVWQLNTGGATNPFLWDAANQREGYLTITASNIKITLEGGTGYPARAWYRIYYDA